MTAAKETTLNEVGEMLTHVVTHMATKEDVARLDLRLDKVEIRLASVDTRLTSIESELRSIRRDLDDLERIPVMFERSLRGERSSCILSD